MSDKIKLELTVEQVNLVLGALAELPFRVSAEMIQVVQSQAQSQITDTETPGAGESTEPAPEPTPKPRR